MLHIDYTYGVEGLGAGKKNWLYNFKKPYQQSAFYNGGF